MQYAYNPCWQRPEQLIWFIVNLRLPITIPLSLMLVMREFFYRVTETIVELEISSE